MTDGIAAAVLDGAQVTVTTNRWPLSDGVKYIRVSMTKQTWKSMVTLNRKIYVSGMSMEQLDEAVVHAVLDMAEAADLPDTWKG